jgi:hypothetical protein
MQQNLRITLEGAQPIDAEFAMSPHDAGNPPSLSTLCVPAPNFGFAGFPFQLSFIGFF